MMEQDENDRSIGRRGVLKGAVAAGVGVAAWSVPSITSLGGTPVYAAVCTSPVFSYEAGGRNTSCGGCDGKVSYKPWSTNQCVGTPFPGTATLVTSGGTPVGNSGVCSDNAFVSVSGVPANQSCVVRVIVRLGNCTGTFQISDVSAPFNSNATVALPTISCATFTSSNIFTQIQVVCSAQTACLPSS